MQKLAGGQWRQWAAKMGRPLAEQRPFAGRDEPICLLPQHVGAPVSDGRISCHWDVAEPRPPSTAAQVGLGPWVVDGGSSWEDTWGECPPGCQLMSRRHVVISLTQSAYAIPTPPEYSPCLRHPRLTYAMPTLSHFTLPLPTLSHTTPSRPIPPHPSPSPPYPCPSYPTPAPTPTLATPPYPSLPSRPTHPRPEYR